MTASESDINTVSCKESVGVNGFGSVPRTIYNCNKFRRCSSAYDDIVSMIGPEFVKRCEEPAIQLNLHSELAGNRLTTVVCLNGQRLEVKYHPQKATVDDIFTVVVDYQKLKEKYLFGLAQLKGDEFVFLELDSKLSKHLNANRFLTLIDDNIANCSTLYLRVKFYVDGDLLRYPSTKHMFYLQLRKDIVECRLSCDVTASVILASFALQCEYGDYAADNSDIVYAYYVPHWLTETPDYNEIVEQIKAVYVSHNGMSRMSAKHHFIEKVLFLPEYGFHFYTVLQEKQNLNSRVSLGICPRGITIFDKKSQSGGNRLELQNFPWKYILRFTFEKCQFLVALQNQSLRHRIVNYQFYTHQPDLCKYLFNLASSHHRFYLRFELRSQESLCSSEVPHGSVKSNLEHDRNKGKRTRKTKLRSQSMLVLNEPKSSSGLPKAVRTLTRYDKATSFLFPKRIKRRLLSSVFKSHGTYTVDEAEKGEVEVANNENISALLNEATGTINSCILNETRSPSLNFEESMSDSLAHRFDNMTGIEMKTERRITAVSLKRDQRNSLGITIMKGFDGAAYVKAARSGAVLGIHPGDRILAVNGKSVQSLCFSRVVEMIRNCTGSVELVLSQTVQHKGKDWSNEDRRGAEVSSKHNNCTLQQLCSELISTDEQRERLANQNAGSCRMKERCFAMANEGHTSVNHSQAQTGSEFHVSKCDDVDGQIFSSVPVEDSQNLDVTIPFSYPNQQRQVSVASLASKSSMMADVGELIFSANNVAVTECGITSNISEMKSCSDWQWMNKPRVCVYDYIHLFLKQVDGDFGFQLKSDVSDDNQDQIVVESVVEQLQQRIKPGDVILEVGGKSVDGLNLEQVVELLEETPQVVHLAIKRRTRSRQLNPQRVRSNCEGHHRLTLNSNSLADSPTRGMVSKHNQPSKDSVDSDFSTDSPSSASSPDFEDCVEHPKTVIWQRNISDSVRARISDIESRSKRSAPRLSFNPASKGAIPAVGGGIGAGGGGLYLMPKFSSLDRPPESHETDDHTRSVEKFSAVKSRPYRPHHSAQLLRSKTMPSVLPQMLDALKGVSPSSDAHDLPKWPVPVKRSMATQPTSWSAPRATSIDDGSNNLSYNSFESMGISRPKLFTLPVTKSFNGGASVPLAPSSSSSSSSMSLGSSNSSCWLPKTSQLLKPEPTVRASRSLTPECTPRRPPLVRQNNSEPLHSPTNETSLRSLPSSGLSPVVTCNWDSKLENLRRKFPFINEKTVFKVTLEKNSRGLGIGICGGRDVSSAVDWSAVFIRIKRLYPLQPALESGKLKIGDIILRVNEHELSELGHYEAVEALRVATGNVILLICRPLPGVLPPLPLNDEIESKALRSLTSVSHFNILNAMSSPVASSQTKEFEVELEKCGGGLGFTLVNDANAHQTGHFIKDLVKDPALSDGRLQPGDQIIKVNDIDLKGLSHEETIQCLRKSPSVVKLLLCRQPDTPSTPQSPYSPAEDFNGRHDKKVLRKEAQDLLFDKIRRKSFESNSNSTSSSSGRRQRLKGYNASTNLSVDSAGDQSTPSNSDVESRRSTPTPTECFRVPNVRSFLSQEALDAVDCQPPSLVQTLSPLKPAFLNVEHRTLDMLDKRELSPGSVPSLHVSAWEPEVTLGSEGPQLRSSDTRMPAYVNGDGANSDPHHLSPSNSFRRVVSCDGVGGLTHSTPKDNFTSAGLKKWRGAALDNCQEKTNDGLVQQIAWELLAVELNKSKNDRLGFTMMAVEIGNLKGSFIRAIQSGGLAQLDGRLHAGDRLLKINGVSTDGMSNPDVIDLLRKQHGRVSLEIARHSAISSSISNLIELSLV